MKNLKTTFKTFLPWQDDQEEKWLGDMAGKGWSLKSRSFLTYRFVRHQPGGYVYKIDYRENSKDAGEYLALFTDSGWEPVTKYSGWQYFRIPEERYENDIYTDNSSKVEKYKKIMTYQFIALVPFIGIIVALDPSASFQGSGNSPFLWAISIGALTISALCIAIDTVWIYYINKKIRTLQGKI